MTVWQQVITIALCVLATQITRWLPFLFFNGKREVPAFVHYLGKVLPAAIFGMLVVYCLKDVDFLGDTHGIAEIIGVAVTALLQLWKKNMFLSIAVGTFIYMILM